MNITAYLRHLTTLLCPLLLAFGCMAEASAQAVVTTAGMPSLSATFDILRQNRSLYMTYQDSVHTAFSDDAWTGFLTRRAATFHDIHGQNSQLLGQLSAYFEQDKSLIPDAAYDSLYTWTDDMFRRSYEDPFLLEQFTGYLLPHFEAKADTVRLFRLYHMAGYYNLEIARSYEREALSQAVGYFRHNIEMSHQCSELTMDAVNTVALDYMNVCFSLAAIGGVPVQESLSLTCDFAGFIEQYAEQMGERLPVYQSYLRRLHSTSFRIYSNMVDLSNPADSAALMQMFEASPYREADLSSCVTAEDSVFYHYCQCLIGKIPVDAAFEACDGLLLSQMERGDRLQEGINERDIQQISNNLTATLDLLNRSSLTFDGKQERIIDYVDRLVLLVQRANVEHDVTFFDHMLAELSCDGIIFRYLPTEKKEPFMSELAVKSQIGTVNHVNMVENLCLILLDGLIDDCPEQFVGMMDCHSVAEVQAHRQELLQYMGMAARFHDLGKNAMAEIVSNDYRRLTDHEFAILKSHPARAMKYLDIDPLFDKYKDVAMGHHKWYNGQGGYPASFDNVASPWRPFIDLLTICDCLDAATDFLGRNYRDSKTFDVVIGEFQAEAGTRYNPVMVGALTSDAQLMARLSQCVSSDRLRLVSEVRKRYMVSER